QIDQYNVELAKNQLWQAQLARDLNNQKKADLLSNPKTAPQAASLPSDTANNKSLNAPTYGVTIAQDNLAADQTKGGNAGSIMSAQAAVTSAQASLNALMAGPNPDDVKQAQANLASAQAAVVSAQQDLAKTRLVAPFDGQVAQVNLSVGQYAPTNQDVVLLDVSSFYVDLPVAELDIANVKVGETVNLHFDSLPNAAIQGKVILVADTANTGTPVTYTVRVVIDPAGQPLLSALSATANIVTSNAANVIRLPNRFIRIDRTRNQTFATVQQPDGSFKEVALQIGTTNDTYTEVKSGLNVGDVVITPQAFLNGGSGGPGGGPRPGGFLRGFGG
ncbi:MAG TPA: efflux RND transporter periplasmic adaptor subunit, partial [Aggregatilineales bacterium]|nr:efflux RND transporter periplasmic adaptor subunit [Aggregatilineales bacterium]